MSDHQASLFAEGDEEQKPQIDFKLVNDLMSMDKPTLVTELIATRLQAAADLRDAAAKISQLQRRVDHLHISLQVFGNLTVVYGQEQQGKATVRCPACMHDHKLGEGTIEPGTRRGYTCPKCKSTISVIFGFDGDQIIEVRERVHFSSGRELLEQQDAQEAYAREGGD